MPAEIDIDSDDEVDQGEWAVRLSDRVLPWTAFQGNQEESVPLLAAQHQRHVGWGSTRSVVTHDICSTGDALCVL
jgi:hypothetical protein